MPRGYRWCRGEKRQGRGRPCFNRNILKIPKSRGYIPTELKEDPSKQVSDLNEQANGIINIFLDELEAMRLVDSENLTQDEAGVLMGISRGSIWRLLRSGRKKLIDAIFERYKIQIPFDALKSDNELDALIAYINKKEVEAVKIGIATEGSNVAQHFGRCQAYTIVEIQDNQIISKKVVESPGHQPGFLPGWLAQFGIQWVICGGMGPRAQQLFQQNNINPITGIVGTIDDTINNFCNGALESGENICDH